MCGWHGGGGGSEVRCYLKYAKHVEIDHHGGTTTGGAQVLLLWSELGCGRDNNGIFELPIIRLLYKVKWAPFEVVQRSPYYPWVLVTMLSPPWWNYPWHVMSDHEPPAQIFNREEEKFDVTADILSPIKWSADRKLSMICDHSGPWDKIRAWVVMDPG